jgi:hypothetical protein
LIFEERTVAYAAWQRKPVAVEIIEDEFVFNLPRVFARCGNCAAWSQNARRRRALGLCTMHMKSTAWGSSCPDIIMHDDQAMRVIDDVRATGALPEFE